VFTVEYLIFGTGVYVADPAAIREPLTGDQSDLRAGEANEPLAPVVGHKSVLVLDGAEHLRQRRLLPPPFQGSAVHAFREVIRDVAAAEVERWQPGAEIVMRDRMRALTFEVICRAVFGVVEPERIERLRAALLPIMDIGQSPRSCRVRCAATSGGRARGAGCSGACGAPTSCCTRGSSGAGASPGSTSAPTSSPCCCVRATRTASRLATSSCATS
jgi:cytochrome P450